MVDRRQDAARKLDLDATEDFELSQHDPSELSRLVAEFTRQKSETVPVQVETQKSIIQGAFPYAALVTAAFLALFSIYQSTPAVPVIVSPPVETPTASVAPVTLTPPTAAEQAAVLPDKLRQISNCELESLHMYPHQGDVRALQVYNLCMTGAGFTPDYSCDTSVGIPAYNPQCWTPGKNM